MLHFDYVIEPGFLYYLFVGIWVSVPEYICAICARHWLYFAFDYDIGRGIGGGYEPIQIESPS